MPEIRDLEFREAIRAGNTNLVFISSETVELWDCVPLMKSSPLKRGRRG